MRSLAGAATSLVLGVAVTVVVVALAILPFLNPAWVGFEQGRAQAPAWTGWTPGQLREVTDAILADLVLGPPEFDAALDGRPVLDARERQHMVDVRNVFVDFAFVAAGAALLVLAAWLWARTHHGRARFWRRISRAGLAIVLVTVIGGGLGIVFFDAAFTLFHELFFPAGSWQFDPGSERLVQLFPEQFWVDTTIAVGIVVVVLGAALWRLGRRRAARNERLVGGPA